MINLVSVLTLMIFINIKLSVLLQFNESAMKEEKDTKNETLVLI